MSHPKIYPSVLVLWALGTLAIAAHGREGMFRAHDYGQLGDGHRYSVPLPELYRRYAHLEWEIVTGSKNIFGHLGTYKTGDRLSLTVSVAPIGGRTYARSKSFGRGSSPMPVIEVLEGGTLKGKLLESIKFHAGAC